MFFIFRKIFADRALFFKMLVASLFVNLLALATPIYVIQVLQRYIAYGVISTLITLFFGIIFIVIFEFFFKNIRHRMARQYELGNVTYANQVLNKLVSIKTQIYEVSKKFRNDIINHHLSNIQNTFSATNSSSHDGQFVGGINLFDLFKSFSMIGIVISGITSPALLTKTK